MSGCDALRTFQYWNRENNAGLPTECPADGDPRKAMGIQLEDLQTMIPEWLPGMTIAEYRQALVDKSEQAAFAENLLPRIYSDPELRQKMLQDQATCSLCVLCSQVIGQNEGMAKWRQTYGSKDSFPSGSNSHRGNRIPIGASNKIRE